MVNQKNQTKIKGLADLYDVSDDWIPIYDRSDLEGFTWPSAPAATSLKMRPWSVG